MSIFYVNFKNLSDVITNYASLLTQSKKRLEEEKRQNEIELEEG